VVSVICHKTSEHWLVWVRNFINIMVFILLLNEYLTSACSRSCADDLFVNQSNIRLPNPENRKLISIYVYNSHILSMSSFQLRIDLLFGNIHEILNIIERMHVELVAKQFMINMLPIDLIQDPVKLPNNKSILMFVFLFSPVYAQYDTDSFWKILKYNTRSISCRQVNNLHRRAIFNQSYAAYDVKAIR